MELGEHTVEIKYDSGETEAKTVEVKREPIETIIFTTEKPVGGARFTRNHFSTGAGFGLTIPVGDVGELMQPAPYPIAFFTYNLSFPWGVIGFGIATGANIDSTKTSVPYQFDLVSVPIAALAQYYTHFDFPLYGFIEIAAGLAINALMYRGTYSGMTDATVGKVYLMPTIGGGWHFVPELAVSIYSSFVMILFDDAAYIGISPGLRVELSF